MNAEEIILDYLQCKISYWDFMKKREESEEIDLYLAELFKEDKVRSDSYCVGFIQESFTSKIIEGVEGIKYRFEFNKKIDIFSVKADVYSHLFAAMKYRYPDLQYCDKYDKEANLSFGAIPEYVNGTEAGYFIEHAIFSKIEEGWSNSRKTKFIKEKVKEYFHREGGKYPHWIQEAEWPVSESGYPMKYLGQKSQGERRVYRFMDEETGECKEIEQFW